MFKYSIKNSFTLSFDSWTSDRKNTNTELEHQVDIGNAHKINSPKYLLAAHQSLARIGTSLKVNNVSVFDNVDVRKYFCDIDGIR